ncbi:MAG: tetratricopeptide repeat protein, partial [Rhodobacteraceae bacterium]|nr:tetratricopeptide repeat protein [Paracoccaceae bacterium]
MTQNNLGNALRTLGQRETGTARLEEAVDAYRAALQERTRDRVPFLWAQTRENMALAHRAIFERTGDPADLDAARRAVAQALEIYEEAGAGFYIEKATRLREDLDQLAP